MAALEHVMMNWSKIYSIHFNETAFFTNQDFDELINEQEVYVAYISSSLGGTFSKRNSAEATSENMINSIYAHEILRNMKKNFETGFLF